MESGCEEEEEIIVNPMKDPEDGAQGNNLLSVVAPNGRDISSKKSPNRVQQQTDAVTIDRGEPPIATVSRHLGGKSSRDSHEGISSDNSSTCSINNVRGPQSNIIPTCNAPAKAYAPLILPGAVPISGSRGPTKKTQPLGISNMEQRGRCVTTNIHNPTLLPGVTAIKVKGGFGKKNQSHTKEKPRAVPFVVKSGGRGLRKNQPPRGKPQPPQKGMASASAKDDSSDSFDDEYNIIVYKNDDDDGSSSHTTNVHNPTLLPGVTAIKGKRGFGKKNQSHTKEKPQAVPLVVKSGGRGLRKNQPPTGKPQPTQQGRASASTKDDSSDSFDDEYNIIVHKNDASSRGEAHSKEEDRKPAAKAENELESEKTVAATLLCQERNSRKNNQRTVK